MWYRINKDDKSAENHARIQWLNAKQIRLITYTNTWSNNRSINKQAKLHNFVEFYRKLFSHEDRPDSEEQNHIENEVKEYLDTLDSEEFSDVFSEIDII